MTNKRRWTDEEIDYLKEASQTITRFEAAQHLDRSYESVKNKCLELGIHFKKRYGGGRYVGQVIESWSKAEEATLWELAERCTLKQIAVKMNKSFHSVYSKCQSRGISLKQGRLTLGEVGEILGVPRSAVPVIRKRLGLKFLQTQNPVNPSDKEIAFMAWHLLRFDKGRVKVSKTHLKQVIQDYHPEYLTETPDFPYTRRLEKVKRTESVSFCAYAVRNKHGRWLRTTIAPDKKTQWLDDLERAKLYTEPAAAKNTVTKFEKRFPDLAPIEYVRIKASTVDVMG